MGKRLVSYLFTSSESLMSAFCTPLFLGFGGYFYTVPCTLTCPAGLLRTQVPLTLTCHHRSLGSSPQRHQLPSLSPPSPIPFPFSPTPQPLPNPFPAYICPGWWKSPAPGLSVCPAQCPGLPPQYSDHSEIQAASLWDQSKGKKLVSQCRGRHMSNRGVILVIPVPH